MYGKFTRTNSGQAAPGTKKKSSRIRNRGYNQRGSVLDSSAAESDSTVGGRTVFRSISVASTIADDQVPGRSHCDDSLLQSTPVTVIKKAHAKIGKLTRAEQSFYTTNTSIQNLMLFQTRYPHIQQPDLESSGVMPPPASKHSYLFNYLELYSKGNTHRFLVWFPTWTVYLRRSFHPPAL